ncbi:MAG: hypothetical protein REH79_00215 [Spiroplasma sp.]|nr:hypothetical protein [Spiroplasma sp.]
MMEDQSNPQNSNPNNNKSVENSSEANNNDKNIKMPKVKHYVRFRKILGFKYFVLAFFWLIFFLLLLTVVILFTTERAKINDINNVNETLEQIARSNNASQRTDLYQKLLDITYPLIDFSLLTFLFFTGAFNSKPINDWSMAWSQRVTNINVAYSYVFITALIALIGLCMYFVIIIKLYRRAAFEKKYDLQPKFHNGYELFDSRIYLRFTRSLAIVFCFFNFLSTLIALTYGIILLLASYFFWYAFKEREVILLRRKWWQSSNFILYFSIALIQNGYNILKSLFSNSFGVDLDLILAVLFPIGTITVILVILIRNLLSTSITKVKQAIKTINVRVASFRIFFYSQKEKSLEDYSFVELLPILVRKPLQKDLISAQEAYDLMVKVNETSIFIEKNFKKESERNYMLYHLFNEITEIAELDDIKANVLKVQQAKPPKDKTSF